jgi:hypothetical protein
MKKKGNTKTSKARDGGGKSRSFASKSTCSIERCASLPRFSAI